jgi:hypothetical protein
MTNEWDERREQKRRAQANYRKRHAERFAQARKIVGILMRQRWYPRDAERLAARLHYFLGKDRVKELRAELGRQIRHGRSSPAGLRNTG